ncbi:MAG: HPF/RaiA family ribosome-associated protein [Saprospiraceae bacterium]|nr:HPF/RaiA family ribosome-associated protein [Saprospiraceae bacterium]
MIIQINTDKVVTVEKRSSDFFTDQIAKALHRFESQITRIEVHLKDENGKDDGYNDISCTIEARLEGKQPIAVNNQADTIDLALSGAIDKVKSSLESILGKIKQH